MQVSHPLDEDLRSDLMNLASTVPESGKAFVPTVQICC